LFQTLYSPKLADFPAVPAADTFCGLDASNILCLKHDLHQISGNLCPVSQAVPVTITDSANKRGLKSPYRMNQPLLVKFPQQSFGLLWSESLQGGTQVGIITENPNRVNPKSHAIASAEMSPGGAPADTGPPGNRTGQVNYLLRIFQWYHLPKMVLFHLPCGYFSDKPVVKGHLSPGPVQLACGFRITPLNVQQQAPDELFPIPPGCQFSGIVLHNLIPFLALTVFDIKFTHPLPPAALKRFAFSTKTVYS